MACGEMFDLDDEAEENDEPPETQPGATAFDGADAWNAYEAERRVKRRARLGATMNEKAGGASASTEGLGLPPERAAPRMGKKAEQAHFAEWIRTACPFDENVGMVENAIQTSAAWSGWLARSGLRDWLYAELQETKRENKALRRRIAELNKEAAKPEAEWPNDVAAAFGGLVQKPQG